MTFLVWQALPGAGIDFTALAQTGFFGLAIVIMLVSAWGLITFVRNKQPTALHLWGVLGSMVMSIVILSLGILFTTVSPQVSVNVVVEPESIVDHGIAVVKHRGEKLVSTDPGVTFGPAQAIVEKNDQINVNLYNLVDRFKTLGAEIDGMKKQIEDLEKAVNAEDESKKRNRAIQLEETVAEDVIELESGI